MWKTSIDVNRPRGISAVVLLTAIAAVINTATYAIPPLTHQQQMRLDTARDGRDHQEEAFVALLENVRQWHGLLGDTPVRLHMNAQQLIDDPDAYRGELYRLSGRLEQQTILNRPHETIQEWFLRGSDGMPVLVFVVGIEDEAAWRDGQIVEIFARFYKLVDAVDRQGRTQRYVSFVGRHPRIVATAPASGMVQLWIIALPVAALLIAFAFLLIFVRRQRGTGRPVRFGASREVTLDEQGGLPDDPADALAELKRRAEAEAIHAND